ncbi:MAG: helix-turn-helix domain-containing protein [Cellulomonadaceae bacterium]|nr:helix-turn-helix domain-containing protein [Cellulomonadaceae bacterium]
METRTRPHDAAPDPTPEPPLADPAAAHGWGGTPWRAAYTVAEAAVTCGVSRRTIGYALERGALVARYPSSRPVILHRDLFRWLEGAPTTLAAAPRRPATGRAA